MSSPASRLRRWDAAPHAARFSRDAGVLMVSIVVLNASNYAFHVVVSHLLGPASYGALASLLAVLMVLSVPVGVVQTVVAKHVSVLAAEDQEAELRKLSLGVMRGLLPFALGGALLVMAISPALASFLKMGAGSVALLSPYLALALLTGVPLGVLQGRLRFGWMAGATIASVVARLAVGVSLVVAGFGVPGAMLGTVASQAVLLVAAAAGLGYPLATYRTRGLLRPLRGEFGRALAGIGGFWLIAEWDVVLARHYLSAHQSGVYSSAGLVGRSLLFLPGAIATAAFPRFSTAWSRREDALRWLHTAVTMTLVICAVGLVPLFLLRHPIIDLAFGNSYAGAARLILPVAVASSALAVASVLVYFHLAAETHASVFLFAATLIETALVARFHASPMQITLVLAGVAIVLAAVLLHAALAAARWAVPGDSAPAPSPAGDIDLSVILPCYNAATELRDVLQAMCGVLEGAHSYELIVVSDGSTDETLAVAHAVDDEHVRVLGYSKQVGKGNALRLGLKEAQGRYVAFMDADGDIDVQTLRSFVSLMDLYEPDIVVGSKRHPLSEVRYPLLRRLQSWAYHKLTRLLFRVPVRDTQTGIKLMRREALQAVLPYMLEKRFAFDLELLVVARARGFTRVFEAPVRIDYQFSSTVAPSTAFRMLADSLAIFYRRYVLNTYRAGSAPHAVTPRTGGLRILFLNWKDVAHPEAGGAEAYTHEVAKRWVRDGHQVTILASGFRCGRRAERIDGVQIRRVGRLRRGTLHLLVQARLARLRDVDVVVDGINTIPFLTPLWRRRTASVALIHQLAADIWDAEVSKPVAAVGRRLELGLLSLYRSTPTVAVSESTANDLRGLGFRSLHVVHGGLDESRAAPPVEKEALPTFLYVGRLARNKRPDHALAALREIRRQLPEARLWVIGRGALEPELRATLPEGAELLGRVSREELLERMARAHALLVPSVREGWGLVVLEANTVGTPAVGYDVPGLRDSIRHGLTGLLAPAGDAAALGAAAVELVMNQAHYTQITAAARDWAERFSWDRTAAAFLNVLEQTVSETTGMSAERDDVPAGAAFHGTAAS